MILFATPIAPAKDPVVKDPWKPTPVMRSVAPDEVKTGGTLTILGDHLDKNRVAEVYLTAGEDSWRLEILTQAETKVTVRVSDKVRPGRMRLMVLTAGDDPQFLEQPLMVAVR